MKRQFIDLFSICFFLLGSTVFSQNYERINNSEVDSVTRLNGVEESYRGVYFRLLAGIGSPKTSRDTYENTLPGEFSVKGTGPVLRLQLGVSVIPNLIVYGEIGGIYMREPDLTRGDYTFTPDNTNFLILDYGLGAIYYIMPLNFYVSTTVTGSQNKYGYQESGKIIYTDVGLGVNVVIGKEWFLSEKFGTGIALFYHFSNLNDQKDETPVRNTAWGIMASFTLNLLVIN